MTLKEILWKSVKLALEVSTILIVSVLAMMGTLMIMAYVATNFGVTAMLFVLLVLTFISVFSASFCVRYVQKKKEQMRNLSEETKRVDLK